MKTFNDLTAIDRYAKGTILTNTVCFIMVVSMMLYWLNHFMNTTPLASRTVFVTIYLIYLVFIIYEILVFGKVFEWYKVPGRNVPFGMCVFATTVDTTRSITVLIPIFFLSPSTFTPVVVACTFIGFMLFNAFLKKMLFPASLLVEIALFFYAVSTLSQ